MDATFQISKWLYFAAQTSETDSFGLVGWWCIIRGDAGLEVPLGELADVEIDIIAEQLVASSLHLCIICHLSTFFMMRLRKTFIFASGLTGNLQGGFLTAPPPLKVQKS